MIFIKQNQGYSLIEVLVAITILLVAIVGPMTIAATGLKNVQFAREQNIAIFLAQEGIEKTHQRRDEFYLRTFFGGESGNNWSDDFVDVITDPDDCGDDGCTYSFTSLSPIDCDPVASCDVERGVIDGLTVYTNAGDVSADSGTLEGTEFSRTIIVSNDSGVLQVVSQVTWDSKSTGEAEQLELHSYIYNTYGL